jgi:hypothetical protein
MISGGSLGRLPPQEMAQSSCSRKKPFRSVPISANTPSELAAVAVKETPPAKTENVPVAVAGRISPAKLEGSVGTDDPGRKSWTGPDGVHVMSKLAAANSFPGPKKNVLSTTPSSVKCTCATPPFTDSAVAGTWTIQNRPD